LIPAMIWTVFFALCPAFFKMISNMGSNAASVYAAGKRFPVAFTGLLHLVSLRERLHRIHSDEILLVVHYCYGLLW
jgi:hypothetical protein